MPTPNTYRIAHAPVRGDGTLAFCRTNGYPPISSTRMSGIMFAECRTTLLSRFSSVEWDAVVVGNCSPWIAYDVGSGSHILEAMEAVFLFPR